MAVENTHGHEHQFLADYQPFTITYGAGGVLLTSAMNWTAVFGLFFVIGRALKLGLGI